MYNKCCVVDCDSRRGGVKLFQFPNSEIGLKKWLKCVSGGENKSLSELRKQYVCEKHFEKRFLTLKSRLRYNAYPTLFTVGEIANGFPETPDTDTENRNPNIDHDYCKPEHNDHNYCKKSDTLIEDFTRVAPSQTLESLSDSYEEIVTKENKEHTKPSCSQTPKILNFTSTVSADTNIQVVPSTSALQETNLLPSVKTPNKFRKRLVHKTALLTPNCKKLYRAYNKSKRKLEFCKKAKKCAISFTKEESFQKLTEGITPVARKLIWMQIKQSGKKTQGRRFDDEEKLICLAIMKQSPKCYRFLKNIFILPSKTTLNNFISGMKIDAGINTHVFNAIREEVQSWDEKRKYCSILFDEVALESGLSYDRHKDVIEGLVELSTRKNEYADHALVFMLRGAVCKWQQPIAFYFCQGQTAAVELKGIIKKIVTAVADAGLKPLTLICDQGAAFRSALKSIIEETKREKILTGGQIDDVIIINNICLSVIYDPPHLLKGLRNNFINNSIKFENKIAKWNDIVEVYKTDCKHAKTRLLHKLNDECVIPNKIKKMKVNYCARVFSKTMSATLAYSSAFSNYSDGSPVSPTLKNTADVTAFFDDLFDSVNGVSFTAMKKGKPLRSVVTYKSAHHEFWCEAIKKILNMRFIDVKGKERLVPTQYNWITTLKTFNRLWQFFSNHDLKIMRPRYFNSDPIENFFGQVRAYNYRNNNPDCHTFKNTFRSLLITRFIKFHSKTFNCEEDSAEQLLKLKSLLCESSSDKDLAKSSISNDNNFNPESFQVTAGQERLNVHSQAYTTGWVIRQILKNLKCSTCESNLTSSEVNSIHKWISIREYKSNPNNKLTYPSEQAVRLFKYINKETLEYLDKQPQQQNILNNIKMLIKSKYSMNFLTCETHQDIQEYFLDYTLRLAIFNWCNSINKILRGTDISRLPEKLPHMQKKAFIKYKTKLKYKNKSF